MSIIHYGRVRTQEGIDNGRLRDAARRRALGRIVAAHRQDFYNLVPPGRRAAANPESRRAARQLRDRYRSDYDRFYQEEAASLGVQALPKGPQQPDSSSAAAGTVARRPEPPTRNGTGRRP